MASLRFEERVEVGAPPETVWRYLIDPERIVVCLPGASLELIEDERTFLGRVTVKVGAVSVGYRGTIEFTELDHEAKRVRMIGKGRESGGSGSATMAMVSSVTETPGGSAVSLEADVKLSGKIVRFGRGMIEGVANEIFQEFGSCLETRLAAKTAGAGAPADPDPETLDSAIEAPPSDAEAPALRLLPLIWRVFRGWLRRVLAG